MKFTKPKTVKIETAAIKKFIVNKFIRTQYLALIKQNQNLNYIKKYRNVLISFHGG